MKILHLRKLEKKAKKINKSSAKKVRRFFRRPSTRWIEVGVFILLLLIFIIKTTNYIHWDVLSPAHVADSIKKTFVLTKRDIAELKYFKKCPEGEIKVDIGMSYLCRGETSPGVDQKIYDTYPIHGNGREIIYPSLDDGDIQSANDFVNNKIDISRYDTVSLPDDPQWDEDPYNDRYWRMNYYSLRPVLDLLYASRTTHDPKYNDKLITTVNSFVTTGINRPDSWDDAHAVAFRTMALTDIWWKMREERILSIDESNKLLTALEQHGEYLADRNHYDPGQNHGTNEAAALYLLANSFPDLPGSSGWLSVSQDRINTSMDNLIDQDGALTENSPYYHFYTLQKYWDIYQYSNQQRQYFNPEFKNKLYQMISYATYILQPDDSPPLLGASLQTIINKHAEYGEMAAIDPQFLYVLTQGKKGKKPKNLNKFYSDTGQTIMRSGWGMGDEFINQTQLIYDVGAYRTDHSDYDALSFSLYSNGITLLPDSGLCTYAPGPYRDYFHGTAAHNTVVVDDKDQATGSASAGDFVTNKDYTLQTAQHQLYAGVTHERSIIMLDKSHSLIIDKLISEQVHNYKQMFHLFPGAVFSKDGLTVKGVGDNPEQSITVQQLKTDGITESDSINQTSPPAGICSEEYNRYVPCESVAYSQNGKDAYFVTLLTIGSGDPQFHATLSADQSEITIDQNHKHLNFKVGQTEQKAEVIRATDPKAPDFAKNSVAGFDDLNNWTSDLGTLSKDSTSGAVSLQLAGTTKDQTMENNKVNIDLSHANMAVQMRITNRVNVKDFELSLSNNHWSTFATNNIDYAYGADYYGEWINISLGKGTERDRNGHWSISGQFDWGKIDGVRLKITGKENSNSTVELGSLYTTPEQQQGGVVIVFDDGYDSVLPAADYLRQLNLKANIAVIAKDVVTPTRGYLGLNDLKNLQNQFGWNIASHSYDHVDAVQAYFQTGELDQYQADILAGAKFLSDNKIDSAPNWFIYPHGTTNSALKAVVSKYYKFARVTTNEPEVYPFGDPYLVKTMSVQNNSDGSEDIADQKVATTPDDVAKAVSDAKNFKTTLFLTFHRIHSKPSDRPGYELTDFKKIADNLKQQNISVLTLSDLDKQNGVPLDNKIIFGDNKPAQLSIEVQVTSDSIFKRIKSLFSWLKI